MSNVDSEKLREALARCEERDYSAALELLLPLANAGNAKARCSLACLYQLGLGVDPDAKKALELYGMVAEQNIREECLSGLAYNNMASIYAVGATGVERDPELARKYRQSAKELGFPM